MTIVNLQKYPINNEEGSTRYQSLLQSSISQLNEKGFVSLPNFLRTDVIDELTSSILQLEQRGIGYVSNDTHSVFLEENDNSNENNAIEKSSMHPRHIHRKSSKLIPMRRIWMDLNIQQQIMN